MPLILWGYLRPRFFETFFLPPFLKTVFFLATFFLPVDLFFPLTFFFAVFFLLTTFFVLVFFGPALVATLFFAFFLVGFDFLAAAFFTEGFFFLRPPSRYLTNLS